MYESKYVTYLKLMQQELLNDLFFFLMEQLEARDAFGNSTATVTINIQNVNDNSPTFTNSTYVGYVQERSASGTSILTLTVSFFSIVCDPCCLLLSD